MNTFEARTFTERVAYSLELFIEILGKSPSSVVPWDTASRGLMRQR